MHVIFFSLVQTLYVMIATSKGHALFIDVQKKLHLQKQVIELQSLSDTRWACRYSSINAIASTYDSIIETLECLSDDTDKGKAVEAIGLLHEINSFRFLALLFHRIFSLTKC